MNIREHLPLFDKNPAAENAAGYVDDGQKSDSD
jgi:hypothetical protein